MRRWLSLNVLIFALALGSGDPAPESSDTQPALGASLAQARFFDLSGRSYAVEEAQAACMAVIFWAYWCDTWKAALPQVQELAGEEGELGCAVWTVSVDGRYTAEVRPLVEEQRLRFPVLLDDGTWTRRLGLRRVPTVLVLNRERRVVWSHEGYPGNAAIEEAIRKAE